MMDEVDQNKDFRPVACRNCRQRRSYCSKDKPSCLRCQKNKLKCEYEENRKIVVNESYLRELERKAKAYDNGLVGPTPGSKSQGSSSKLVHERGSESDDLVDDPLLESLNNVTVEEPSSRFRGPGSSDNFFKSLGQLPGFRTDNHRLDATYELCEPGALPCRRGNHTHAPVRLPSVDIARRWFAAQYAFFGGTIFAFTDPDEMFPQLMQVYQGPPDPTRVDECVLYAKVLVVLALGQLYSVNQWVGFNGPPGFEYFLTALHYLPEIYETGSVSSIETFSMVGYYMQILNRREAAALYIGVALRMAISLGLHREVHAEGQARGADSNGGHDEVSRERRRRAWWSIYSLDRILTVKSGNPLTIQDDDIHVNLPSRLPHEPEYCAAVMLRHYTQLSQILSDVYSTIYRRPAQPSPQGRVLKSSVQAIVLALSKWRAELPAELRLDPTKAGIARDSVSLFSHYYQCINMTLRPLLFHVIRKRLEKMRSGAIGSIEDAWEDGLSSFTINMVDLCVKCAQDAINMMAIAAQKDHVATYGFMDGEHIFSASIVLVMACEAFPAHVADPSIMHTGLKLLQRMGSRGNDYMRDRYELLSSISTSWKAKLAADIQQQQLHQQQGSYSLPALLPESWPEQQVYESFIETAPSYLDEALAFSAADGIVVDTPSAGEAASVGVDFGIWEASFANPSMDYTFDYPQGAQDAAELLQASGFVALE